MIDISKALIKILKQVLNELYLYFRELGRKTER